MDPLKLLHDGLYIDDTAVVLKTLRRLETVALALGPSRARAELLPMLSQFATLRNADEMANENAAAAVSGAECAGVSPLQETFDRVVSDEALSVLAEQLGELCSPVANVPANSVVPMLEALMQADETCVREAAVRGASRIATLSTPAQVLELLLPCCERLASTTWFSGRCSSAQLITPIYKRLTSDQGKSTLRQIIAKLISDETPMVRKAAFAALPELCSIVGVTFLRTDLVTLLRALCEEDQDASRVYLADCAVETAKVIDATLANDISIPLVEEASADMSWRVRRHLARRFGAICAASPAEIQSANFMPIFSKLLVDLEGEVRTAAIDSIIETATAAGPALTTQYIVPAVKALSTDPLEDARFGFAKVVPALCRLVDAKAAQSTMFPLLLQLLTDDIYDVRMNVLDNIDVTMSAFGNEHWAQLLAPTLTTLSNDAKWRIRLGVVLKIPSLTKNVPVSVYEQKYHSVIMRLICDPVAEVRTTTASQVKFLIQNFGTDWGQTKLIPEILKLLESKSNYLHRLIPHQIAMECITAFKGQFATTTLASLLINSAKDPTPNVRLNAARCLIEIAQYLETSYKSTQVKPVLQKLKDDPDPDVMFFAEQALIRYS